MAPGIYVYFGANELMTVENEGAIANVGFVVGDDACCRHRYAAAVCARVAAFAPQCVEVTDKADQVRY